MGEAEVHFDASLFRSNTERIFARLKPALVGALRAEAARLEGEANSYAPADTGDLKASSFVDAGLTDAGNPAATMGYEDPHAGAIHEGFHFGRKRKTEGRYWLQKSANRSLVYGFGKRMAQVIRGVIG